MDKLVFLTYMNRSGSTFLCQRLSAYNEILVIPEAEALIYRFLIKPFKEIKLNNSFKEGILHIFQSDSKIKHWQLDFNALFQSFSGQCNFDFFIAILNQYRKQHKPNAQFLLFKGTRLINILPHLQKNAPQVPFRVISLIRDPRDIYFSQRQTRNQQNQKIMCNNPVQLSKHWDWYINQLECFSEHTNWCQVKYEQMILDIALVEEQLLGFLEVNSIKKSTPGDLLARIPLSHIRNHKNIDKEPDKTLINQWHNNFISHQHWISIIQITSRLLPKYYEKEKAEINVKAIALLPVYYLRCLIYLIFSRYSYNK